MNGDDRLAQQTPAVRRLLEVIEQGRPAAIAGWAEFWAGLAGLSVEDVRAGLEALAARGVVRRQALGEQVLYISDPPHASPPPRP